MAVTRLTAWFRVIAIVLLALSASVSAHGWANPLPYPVASQNADYLAPVTSENISLTPEQVRVVFTAHVDNEGADGAPLSPQPISVVANARFSIADCAGLGADPSGDDDRFPPSFPRAPPFA